MKNWKQFIAICLAYALLTVGACLSVPAHAGMSMTPGTPVHTHSDANTGGGSLALSGTLSSTKACASGFTRVTPNFCKIDVAVTYATGLVTVGTCYQSPALTGVTNAKAVLVQITSHLNTNNAIGLRAQTSSFYAPTDNTCVGNSQHNSYVSAREAVAVASVELLTSFSELVILVSNSNGQVYAKPSSNTSGGGFYQGLYTVGYFD